MADYFKYKYAVVVERCIDKRAYYVTQANVVYGNKSLRHKIPSFLSGSLKKCFESKGSYLAYSNDKDSKPIAFQINNGRIDASNINTEANFTDIDIKNYSVKKLLDRLNKI